MTIDFITPPPCSCTACLQASHECPSCHGLNLSCPVGCGRDSKTGELNGTTLEPVSKPNWLPNKDINHEPA